MLTLRHTGFSSPVYRDQLDYTVYEDGPRDRALAVWD
jgi:hypothetical protein